MKTLNSLIDFIFPKTSIISGRLINEDNSNQYINNEESDSLGRVSEKDLKELKDKLDSDYCLSIFTFREKDDFSKIIYNLKYAGMKKLGNYLGNLLGNEIQNKSGLKFSGENDLLIPVPLHKTKYRERGYNQSDFICEGVNEILKINYLKNLIKRTRHTLTQTKLNRRQRMENMKDAFELNNRVNINIEGRNIILIDDVITTGSTLNEVIKVVRENNCRVVIACTVAMARD